MQAESASRAWVPSTRSTRPPLVSSTGRSGVLSRHAAVDSTSGAAWPWSAIAPAGARSTSPAAVSTSAGPPTVPAPKMEDRLAPSPRREALHHLAGEVRSGEEQGRGCPPRGSRHDLAQRFGSGDPSPTEKGVARPPLQSTPAAAEAPSISPRSVSTPAPGTMATGTLRHAACTCSATRSSSCASAPETKTSPPEGEATSARVAARDRPSPSSVVTEVQKLRAAIAPIGIVNRPRTKPYPGPAYPTPAACLDGQGRSFRLTYVDPELQAFEPPVCGPACR